MLERVLAILRWVPLVGGAAYGTVMAVNLRAIVFQLYWNSDLVSPVVLAESWAALPVPKTMALSAQPTLTTIGAMVLTSSLPGHRTVWALATYALVLAGVALLAATSWRLAGRWAGLMTLTIAGCVAAPLMQVVVPPANHSVTLFNTIVLAALTAFVYRRDRLPSSALLLACAVLIGIITGMNAASDGLLVVTGVLPLVIVALTMLALHPGRRSLSLAGLAAITAVVAVVSDVAFGRLMRVAGFLVPPGDAATLASAGSVGRNVRLLGRVLLQIANADFLHEQGGLLRGTEFVLVVGAIIGLAVVGFRPLVMWRAARGSDAGERGGEVAYTIFWAVAVGTMMAAFVLSNVPAGLSAVRYTATIFVGVAGTVPLWARHRRARQLGVAAGGVLFCVTSAILLDRAVAQQQFRPTHTLDMPQVIAFLEQRGLSYGYSTYWDANAVTWKSDGQVTIRAAAEVPGGVTRFTPNSIDAWYAGDRPGPSFLLVDPDQEFMNGPPSESLGRPSEVDRVGRFVIYVYPDDVARRFRPDR